MLTYVKHKVAYKKGNLNSTQTLWAKQTFLNNYLSNILLPDPFDALRILFVLTNQHQKDTEKHKTQNVGSLDKEIGTKGSIFTSFHDQGAGNQLSL